ncbi:MAG: hypothetical protein ABFE08_23695 [Armatimonadia bacterium]
MTRLPRLRPHTLAACALVALAALACAASAAAQTVAVTPPEVILRGVVEETKP